MHVRVWSDYICPWCYLGRDRTALLRARGADVTVLPFELHPDLPAEGRAVRPDGRLASLHRMIAAECEAAGMAFRPPTHIPNSRRALDMAEIVRARWPSSFAAVDDALMTAHFVEGRDIGDLDVLGAVAEEAGAPGDDVVRAVASGEGHGAVDASIAAARAHGIAATPAWLFDIGSDDDGFVIPGVQPRELFARVVDRLRARTGEMPAGPGR